MVALHPVCCWRAGADLGVLEFRAASAGAKQVHVLPVTSLQCCRAKSASTGAVLGGDGGQAGIAPGHQEEAMGVLGTASLPSSQTICSPGCECCELAWGQSGSAIWPLCTRSTEPWWALHASTARASLLEHPVLGQPVPHVLALQVSCPCRDLAVPVLGCWWLQEEHGPCTALQGRVHAVGRAPRSLPGFGNRPDQFPRALASSTDLTAACQPHAALSFGLELPARLGYPRPKHPLVLCCRLQPHCPADGTSTRAAPALSKLGKESRSGV